MADRRSVFWTPPFEAARACDGRGVPRLEGEALVNAMRENVSNAMTLYRKAQDNLERCLRSQEIVEDAEAGRGFRAVGDAGRIAMSDMGRARVELAHWNEYLEWAKAKRDSNAMGGPDPRLPPEREPGEDDDVAAVPF